MPSNVTRYLLMLKELTKILKLIRRITINSSSSIFTYMCLKIHHNCIDLIPSTKTNLQTFFHVKSKIIIFLEITYCIRTSSWTTFSILTTSCKLLLHSLSYKNLIREMKENYKMSHLPLDSKSKHLKVCHHVTYIRMSKLLILSERPRILI